MGSKSQTGFTIIEVMLFLGVSSLLMVGLMVGIGNAVQQRRYTAAVDGLKSYLQEQYSFVANTVNDRDGAQSCGSGATITPGVAQRKGTSDCLVIGRYLRSNATSGATFTAYDVVAYKSSDNSVTSDIDDLRQNYRINVTQPVNYGIEWGASVGSGANRAFSLLIVRSPRSGSIMAFKSGPTVAATSATGLISMANYQRKVDMCVQGDRGLAFGVKPMAVSIASYASSQSAVQILPESESNGVCA